MSKGLDTFTELKWLAKVGGHVGKGRTKRSYGSGLTGTVERVCPGGRHAWLNTSVGLRRKPDEG
jgi:hypothetical protein